MLHWGEYLDAPDTFGLSKTTYHESLTASSAQIGAGARTEETTKEPPMMLTFEVIQEIEGSFVAACYDENIYTDGATLEELHDNISAALDEKFNGRVKPEPANIKMVLYRE